MRRVLRRGLQTYDFLDGRELDPNRTSKEFRDERSTLYFLRGFKHEHLNMVAMRSILASSFCQNDLSLLNDDQVLEQFAWELISGRVTLVPIVPAIVAVEPAVAKEPEEKAEDTPPPVQEPPEEEELEFVLMSTTGHILPFHPFKVYDGNDNEIASGETDENGEALVDVPEGGDYFVLVDSEDTFSVSGTVYLRDGVTPLANALIEVWPWEEASYSVDTGEKGELRLTEIPEGELVLDYQGSPFSVYVDSNISSESFFIPHVEEQKEEDTEEDIDLVPDVEEGVELLDINPDHY